MRVDIHIRIDSDTAALVTALAERERRSLSAQVELLIEAGLRSQGIEPANVSAPNPPAPRR